MSMQNSAVKMMVLVLPILVASCGSPGPTRQQLSLGPSDDHVATPEYFGLYAVTSDGLVRLNGDKSWEVSTWNDRNDLNGNVRFLVYSRWISMDAAPGDQAIVLQRVAHVRSIRAADGTVTRKPDVWDAPNLPQYRIPLRFAPVEGHSDMLIAAPEGRLPPGLYQLSFHGPENWSSRLGVAWPSVAAGQYDSKYCVDKLPQGFVPCGQEAVAATSTDIAIRDLRSSRMTGDGPPRLVIDGNVVNTSQAQVTVPPFSVVLMDAQHQVLQSLNNVNVDVPMLMPGRSYHFRIVVTNAAADATQVRVTPSA